MNYIDFRSDTVTQPTKTMRLAMMNAKVGDNILGEDPTVIELEEYSANLFNKEAALFVLSGTMANQIAVMTLTNRGEEIILSKNSHLYNLEVAALATLSQVQAHPLETKDGKFDLNDLESAIRKEGIQNPKTSLIAIENTYDLNRGLVLDKAYFDSVKNIATRHNIPLYLDGARIFNASTALNIELDTLTENIDALQFCLTKGLAAPIGSILVGSKTFIEKAKWIRQRLGGGMRQAGHMAGAGLVALKEMRSRLVIDHDNANSLANKLYQINSSLVDLSQVQSNIVKVNLMDTKLNAIEFANKLLENNIKVKVIGDYNCRMITHLDISKDNIEFTTKVIKEILND
jgi:threonine aldolase